MVRREKQSMKTEIGRGVKRDLRVHSGPEYMVVWNLNSLCNFRCEYCFLSAESLSREHPDVGHYSPEHIARCFDDTGRVWRVHMSGGEPFLYPDFAELCRLLTRRHFISINTNLSSNEVMSFGATISPERVLTINAGLHLVEREKRAVGVEKYLEKFLYLQERGFKIRLEYVVYPPLLGRVKEDVEILRARGVQLVNLKMFRGTFAGRVYPGAYTEEEKNLLEEIALDSRELEILDGRHEFFGRLCAAGHRSFNMDQSGNLNRCLTIKKPHGNLFTGKSRFDKQPRPCTATLCKCPYEGMQLIEEGTGSKLSVLIEESLESYRRKRRALRTRLERFLAPR